MRRRGANGGILAPAGVGDALVVGGAIQGALGGGAGAIHWALGAGVIRGGETLTLKSRRLQLMGYISHKALELGRCVN